MIDYSTFRSSLKRLEEQNGNHRQGNPALSDLDRDRGIPSSASRLLRLPVEGAERYLTLGVADTPNSPKPVFRLAHENDLLAAPLDADARIDTSHDCDGEKAKGRLG